MKIYLKIVLSVMFWIFLIGIAIPWTISINFTPINWFGMFLIISTPFMAIQNYKIFKGEKK